MSYNADRVYETSTTSGAITTNSVITVAGAFASNYQTFQNRVKVGDPCHVTIVDAAGAVWIDFEGTLTTTTTITINTIEDSSAGLGTGVTLTAGTHKVLLSFGAFQANKRVVMADHYIDHIASGLKWTAASGLNGNMSAGVAYVAGQRISKGSVTNHAFTASKDTYVDLGYDGTITYAESTNNLAAQALTANSLRIAKVVTSGAAITSVVNTDNPTKDSLGNWIGNTVRSPACYLYSASSQTVVHGGSTVALTFTAAGNEILDNDNMHSTSSLPTRITINRAGFYFIQGFVEYNSVVGSISVPNSAIKVNGAVDGTSYSTGFGTSPAASSFPTMPCALMEYLPATTYIELCTNANDASNDQTVVAAGIRVVRLA